jgi:hypothetical protein
MRLKLKEDPREWRNFALALCAMLLLLCCFALRRGLLSVRGLGILAALLFTAGALAWIFPVWFRTVYRVGMTVFFRVGQLVQLILLSLIYCLCVVPLSLGLRLFRKDLLQIRKNSRTSYWKEARPPGPLDKLF